MSYPQWFDHFTNLYQSGVAHAFMLHFNTRDYTAPDITCTPAQFLAKRLAARPIVLTYSRDRGFEFSSASGREKAIEILGLDQKPNAADPALVALAALGQAPAPNSDPFPRNPREALPLIDRLLREAVEPSDGLIGTAAVIIDDAELIAPDIPLATMSEADRDALAIIGRWGRDSEIVGNGNPIFMITSNLGGINQSLKAASNRWEAIEIGLPRSEERAKFVKTYAQERDIKLGQFKPATLGNLTAGLSLMHLEDIMLRAALAGELTEAIVQERKEQIIRQEYADVLEIINPRFTLDDIGGLDHVKKFFKQNVIKPIREGRKSRVPMGVLLTGPAGTGKSIMAEAVAHESQINAVNLRVGGQIASKWQGEGERNLDRALRAIAGLAPTLVFIDEIDQVVNRGDGGNQQNSRIFQRLLEFMSDTSHRGEIIFLAATNRPDLMDAALRRPGRFDKKIPFLVPDRDDREAIFCAMSRRYQGKPVNVSTETLDLTAGWTGAEIEAATIKALEIIEDEGQHEQWAFQSAVERLSPSTADIEFMTALAIQECNDRDLLPPKYQQALDNRQELNNQIATFKGEGNVKRGQRRSISERTI